MLGCIKKSFARFDCRLILPLLEFAIPVWSPYLKGYCEAIGRVQYRATQFVHTISNLKYEDRLIALTLTTLNVC